MLLNKKGSYPMIAFIAISHVPNKIFIDLVKDFLNFPVEIDDYDEDITALVTDKDDDRVHTLLITIPKQEDSNYIDKKTYDHIKLVLDTIKTPEMVIINNFKYAETFLVK
jgi:hypothetical protein